MQGQIVVTKTSKCAWQSVLNDIPQRSMLFRIFVIKLGQSRVQFQQVHRWHLLGREWSICYGVLPIKGSSADWRNGLKKTHEVQQVQRTPHSVRSWGQTGKKATLHNGHSVLVDKKLTMSQQCTLVQVKANCIVGRGSKSSASRLMKVVTPLFSVWDHTWNTVSTFISYSTQQALQTGMSSVDGHQDD